MIPRPGLIPALAAAIGVDALEFLAPDPTTPSLEDMRLAAGLTMQCAADKLGISLRSYRGMESGSTRREPSVDLLAQLAQLFAVPVVTIKRAIDINRM